MDVVVGLTLGAGLFCMWWSTWESRPRGRREGRSVLSDQLIQAGMEAATPGAFLSFCSVLVVVTGLVGLALTRSVPIAACFALMAGASPLMVVRGRARRRRAKLNELWPEVIDNLASGVRAGLSLPEALSQLGERAPAELRPQFKRFAREYRISGRFEDCLDQLKNQMADPVADRIVESLRIARDVGGTDLGRLLRTLSTFLREDNRTRGELEARQSWTVAGARLAAAGPWAVLAFLGMRPETASAYNSMVGALVLLVGAGISVAAYQLMLRIGRLPADVRVLR